MKKLLCVFVLIFMLPVSVYAQEDITVLLNGSKMEFEQAPVIMNDSTLVPLRAIFESLGMKVDWDGNEKRVTAAKKDLTLTLFIDRTDMNVNSSTVNLNTPPVIINDFTLVPLRAVSEASGADVDWDGETRTVTITYSNSESEEEIFADRIFELTNAEREKAGAGPLIRNTKIESLAKNHCADMINRGFFNHENPDGDSPFDRFRKADITYRHAGENIAAGQKTPEQAMEEWLSSPGHKDNILNPDYTDIGISVMCGGKYGIYWVQVFFTPIS